MPNLLALLAAAVLGIADFLGGVATRRSSAIPVMVVSQTVSLALLSIALVVVPAVEVRNADLYWGALAGVAGSVGMGLLYHGLARGVMSVVAPVVGVVSAVVPVVVGIVLGERPAPLVLAGIALAILAIGLVTWEPRSGGDPAQSPAAMRSVVSVAVSSGLCIGVFYVALSRTLPASGLWPVGMSRLAGFAVFAVAALVSRAAWWPPRQARSAAVWAGVLDVSGTVLYVLSVQRGLLAVVGVLTSLYPAATIALATFVLRERLTRTRIAGLACAGGAVVLIVGG